MNSVKLNGSLFTLYKMVGKKRHYIESGKVCSAEFPGDNGPCGVLVLGHPVTVGSLSRWWTTTPIEDFMIVSADRTELVFKTRNSTYTIVTDRCKKGVDHEKENSR